MKITKFVQSCLLVEMPEPVSRTVLFDPGEMSAEALLGHTFEFLDDIVITHSHGDHLDLSLVAELAKRFPEMRILGPQDVVDKLEQQGITASVDPSEGLVLFDAPHEDVQPMFPTPTEIGVHYLDKLTHPGDSHSFNETKEILALPVQAPWGSTINAVKLALKLHPQHILPIHDWHWNNAARKSTYNRLADLFSKEGITFHKLETGQPVVIE